MVLSLAILFFVIFVALKNCSPSFNFFFVGVAVSYSSCYAARLASKSTVQTNHKHKSLLVFCKYSKQYCTMICYCFKLHSTFF